VTGMSIDERIAARLKLVEEHIRLENQHDLEEIMGTFGACGRYPDCISTYGTVMQASPRSSSRLSFAVGTWAIGPLARAASNRKPNSTPALWNLHL
jgi:hypothetical protein